MRQSTQLLLLFVVLPIVAGVVVMVLVAWRSPGVASGTRTSELLAHGQPGTAEILGVRRAGGVLDVRPMMFLRLSVRPADGGDAFDVDVVQALPRRLVSDLRPGVVVGVRVAPDHSAAAIVLSEI